MMAVIRTLAASVVAVAAVAVLSGCRKTTQPPPTAEAAIADSAEQVMFDVHYVMTDRGVKRGDMYADTMYVFNDQTKFVLLRVHGTFTTEFGAPNGTFKGDHGTYNTRTQTLEGFGNVLLTSTDGKVMSSNHLKYVESLNKVSSDSAYRLKRGADVSTGIGFDSDPNLKVFKCHRRCGGEALVPLKGLDKP
jgi:LPS export ABC transporter protein LptC